MAEFRGATSLDDSEEEIGFSGATKLEENDVDIVQSVTNLANDINLGLTQIVPGLNYFTSKVGIGEDIPRGPDGQPSVAQGAARMVGTAGGLAAATLAAPLKAAAEAPRAAAIMQENMRVGGIKDAVTNFLSRTARVAGDKPLAFFGSEATAAAAAGAAGQKVENLGGTPEQRMAAEIGAGAVVGGAVPLAKKAAEYTMTGAVLRRLVHAIKSRGTTTTTVSPTTFGVERAQKRISGAIPDTEDYIARSRGADVLEEAPLTPGERAEEPGLLSLERAVVQSSEELSFVDRARFDEINQIIRSEMRGVGGESNPAQAKEYLDSLLDERIRIAGVQLDERLSRVSPKTRRQQTSELARKAIDEAYNDAKTQEKQFWSLVPKDAKATPSRSFEVLKGRLDDIESDRVRKYLNNLPPSVRMFLGRVNKKGKFVRGKMKNGATVQEVQSLRSELLREARAERAMDAPDREKLSLLHDLQESLLDDLKYASEDDNLQVAIDFSRSLNQKFRQGDVGMILGYDRTGEGAVAPILTLERTLGKSGRAGTSARQSANELLSAAPDMKPVMEDFLRDEFLLNSRTGDDFKPNNAQRYLDTRKELLDLFPGLRKEFQDAVEAGNAYSVAQKLKSPTQTPAAVVLGAPPGKEMNRIINSASPEKAVSDLMAKLETDETGRAVPAMRRAAVDWLLDSSSSKSILDASEQPVVLGSRMKDALDDPAISKALNGILEPQQIKRLRTIQNTAIRMERSKKATPAQEGVLNDVEGMVSELVRSVIAAGAGRNIARHLGMGGTVQIPGKFVAFSNRLRNAGIDPARKLIIDAVTAEDDKLLRSILTVPKTPVEIRFAKKQLNAWMFATAQEYAMDKIEE